MKKRYFLFAKVTLFYIVQKLIALPGGNRQREALSDEHSSSAYGYS